MQPSTQLDSCSSWLVAIFACVALGMHFGILNCGALFYHGLVDLTGLPISTLSWLITGQYAMTFCLAPLYNRLHQYIKFRIAIAGATLLTSGSLIGASYVHSFIAFFVLYTVLGGIGLGISAVRVVGITAERFDKYRILALALCTSGSGLGTFIYSKLGGYMIEVLTWRVALMGYGILHLNVIPVSLLLRKFPMEEGAEPAFLLNDQVESILQEKNNEPVEDGRGDAGANVFTSLLSMNSMSGLGAQRKFLGPQRLNDSSRRIMAARQLRALIEFAKCCRISQTTEFTIEPMLFVTDPGAAVVNKLKDLCKEYLMNTNHPDSEVIYVPVLFLVGELNAALAVLLNTSQGKMVTQQELNELLVSQFDLGSIVNRLHQTSNNNLNSAPFVGDSLSASVIIAQERKQARNIVRQTVQKAEKRAKEMCENLIQNGLNVCPSPIVVLVEQDSDVIEINLPQVPSSDKMCVLSYPRFEDEPILEVAEPGDVGELQEMPRITASVHNLSTRLRAKSSIHTSSHLLSMGSQYLIGSRSKGLDSFIIRSASGFAKDRKISCTTLQSRDMLTSLRSVCDPQMVNNLIVSKVGDQTLVSSIDLAKDSISGPILLNLLFFSFLLTRLFVYITDSIIFAHLNYFALSSGLNEEQAATLLSFVGIAAMLSRVGTGFIGQFLPRCDARTLTSSCLLFLAVYIVVMPLYSTYAALSAFSILYGVFVSPSFAFAPVMAYEIVGPSRYDEAVSYWFQFEAIGYLIGGPIGGALKDINNNYMDCFIFAGTCDLVAALTLFVQGFILNGVAKRLTTFVRETCCPSRTRSKSDVEQYDLSKA